MTYYTYVDSPVGRLLLVSNGEALTGLFFEKGRDGVRPEPGWQASERAIPFPQARAQLREYFAGKRRTFDVPLRLSGTVFQQRVWQTIAAVPFGKTITYRELAARTGHAEASRAAGAATGRNPVSIIVPCHRVVGSDGSLTGFGGGLYRKQQLLALEGIAMGPRALRLRQPALFDTA